MAINVQGVFLGMKHVLPVMIAQQSGVIVNTASVAGKIGSPGMVAYIASKHAVIGMTRTAALEVAKLGIRVNAEADEVANLMLYLASDLATHITGQSVLIDGGNFMN